MQIFSAVLSSSIDRIIRKRLLHLLIEEVTIDKNRNIDSIKLKLSMMAGDKDFNNYYSNKSLTRTEFYSVMGYAVEHIEYHGVPDFTEPCRLGSDTMLSRMLVTRTSW